MDTQTVITETTKIREIIEIYSKIKEKDKKNFISFLENFYIETASDWYYKVIQEKGEKNLFIKLVEEAKNVNALKGIEVVTIKFFLSCLLNNEDLNKYIGLYFFLIFKQ
jgi:hypothetical protein